MSVKVEFRKDRKKFQVTYYVEGKRKRPLFQSKLEADNFARKVRLGIAELESETITIDEAGSKYFELVSSVKKSPKSKSNDKLYINLHYHFMTYERGIERLGTVALEDLEAFRDWLPALRVQPWDEKPKAMRWSNSTTNRCLRVIKAFYRQHIRWKAIERDPGFYLEFLDAEAKERSAMTPGQYAMAREKTEAWFRPTFDFMYATGTPASSVSRMQWSDVQFVERQYTTWRKKGRKARIKRVTFGMTSDAFAILIAIRNAWPAVEGAVFRDKSGRPLLADRITRIANQAIRDAGIREQVSMYGARHALATDMTEANVATEQVRRAMGHQSIVTTQGYANKVGLKVIANAVETVRGGSLVAEAKNEAALADLEIGVN